MPKLSQILGATCVAGALTFLPLPALAADGPISRSGELDGVAYEIRVPADWNGTLVMYAHGYRDAADHPGETEDHSAQAFVNDLVEDQLLAAGYAVAGSAYAANGWAVKEGIHDTKALRNYFAEVVGQPETTLIAGFSMGSLVAYESIEKYDGVYDGAMPSCSVGAGAPRAWDGTLALALAYDAVFGWPAAWGKPADVRDDLDFDSEVLPVLSRQLNAPGGAAKFELLRLVAGAPKGPEWPYAVWFFATEGRAELERRAGGPVAQNASHRYGLSNADRAYLAGLGITGEQVAGYLATMMANRVAAVPGPRGYVERYADYTGQVDGPVLTLGTTTDALVPPAHISAYDETVAAAGTSDLVAHAWTSGGGHCDFTPTQLVTSVKALDTWVHTGVKPAAFPADQGFVNYTPPPWPQP